MHPFTIQALTADHVADLRRDAVANCCAALVARAGLRDRVAALTAAVRRHPAAAPACCPA